MEHIVKYEGKAQEAFLGLGTAGTLHKRPQSPPAHAMPMLCYAHAMLASQLRCSTCGCPLTLMHAAMHFLYKDCCTSSMPQA